MKHQIIPRQPWPVTIQAAIVLFFTTSNAVRFGVSLFYRDTLAEFGASPLYIGSTGLVWATAGGLLFIMIWQAKRLARRAGILLATLYTLFLWYDKFAIQSTPSPNTPFLLGISILPLMLFLLPFALEEGELYYTKEMK